MTSRRFHSDLCENLWGLYYNGRQRMHTLHYYKHVMGFPAIPDGSYWKRVMMNSVVHIQVHNDGVD